MVVGSSFSSCVVVFCFGGGVVVDCRFNGSVVVCSFGCGVVVSCSLVCDLLV